MIGYRVAAVAGFALVVFGILALAAPLVVDLAPEREGGWFAGGLAAAAAGLLVQVATVGLLVARRRPDPALRRKVRDLCLQLGIVGLLEAAFLLSRRGR